MCRIKLLCSLRTPAGCLQQRDDSLKCASRKMLVRQTKIARENRRSDSLLTSTSELKRTVRMWEGLKLACKDIKVLIFALMASTQLLGLSFVNFFPT